VTIDPAKFEPQGKPTREQVRAVWDAHPKPSTRKVRNLLVARGFDISFRTIARWVKNEWREDAAPGAKPLAEKGEVRAVNKAITAALKAVPKETVKEADMIAEAGGIEGAVTGGKLQDADYARIEARIKALEPESKDRLLEIQERARLVMNIVLTEEATRRAHVMVLIPKDTGSFIKEVNEAATSGGPVAVKVEAPNAGNGDDARVIEGKVNPPSALSLKLRMLREAVA